MAPAGEAFYGLCSGKIDSADLQVRPHRSPIYELDGHIFLFSLGAVFLARRYPNFVLLDTLSLEPSSARVAIATEPGMVPPPKSLICALLFKI